MSSTEQMNVEKLVQDVTKLTQIVGQSSGRRSAKRQARRKVSNNIRSNQTPITNEVKLERNLFEKSIEEKLDKIILLLSEIVAQKRTF